MITIQKNHFNNKSIFDKTIFVGLLILIFCSIYNTSKYGATLSWVIFPTLVIIISGFFSIKKIKIKRYISLFSFWLLFTFSTLLSTSVKTERNILTFLIFCLLFLFATSKIYSKKEIHSIVSVYIFVAFTCELNVIINWLNGHFYSAYFKRSSFYFLGVFKDPNYTMAYITPAVFFSFVRTIKEKQKNRFFYFTTLLFGIACSFASGSRASLLTFFLSIFFYLMFLRNRKNKILIIFLILFILLISFFIVSKLLPTQAIERIFNGDQGRIQIWKEAFQVFLENPLIGAGINSASTRTQTTLNIDSHNVYLDILTGSGIIGFSLFCAFFFLNCFKFAKKDKSIMLSSIVVFMLPMFFINGFNTATFYLPLIILSIFSNYSVNNKNLSEIF